MKTSRFSEGEKTRRRLKKLGIKSPVLKNGIVIGEGVTVYPKKKPRNVKNFISEMRYLFKIKD